MATLGGGDKEPGGVAAEVVEAEVVVGNEAVEAVNHKLK